VSDAGHWPGGARGALCLSFDNLGEVAEIELGAIRADEPREPHPTVTEALPAILAALKARQLPATFFVEGLNAELYPEALREIDARGHEVAFHAWRHEQWAGLSAAEQTDNLARGAAAFAELGLSIAGMRPPGGPLGGAGALEVLRSAGLSYCSPAGTSAGLEDGVAVLPFDWRHVDASCVLPPLGTVRERISGSAAPLGPDDFLAFLGAELERLADDGGFLAVVLHPFMLGWFGEERLGRLLDRAARAAADGDLLVAPCAEAAAHVHAHPEVFRGAARLDPTSWTAG
jgi:peptidoglycan/xylan/chitin deacetylase (PgdA/CDA1 family)